MEILTVADFPSICRFCTSTDISSQLDTSIINALHRLTQIEVSRNDQLPNNVCSECINCLNDTFSFLLIIRNNEACLNRLLSAWELANPLNEIHKYNENPQNNYPQNNQDNVVTEREILNLSNNSKAIDNSIVEHDYCKAEYSSANLPSEDLIDEVGANIPSEDVVSEVGEALTYRKVMCHECGEMFLSCALDFHLSCHAHQAELAIKKRRKKNVHKPPLKKQCSECKRTLTQQSLKGHLLMHMNKRLQHPKSKKFRPKIVHEKTTQCTECGIMLAPQYLRRHSLKHAREELLENGEIVVNKPKPRRREFPCYKCGKMCHSKNWRDHLLTHTLEKPHTCKLCNKKYRQSMGLLRHIRVVHKGLKVYKCNICDSEFKDWNTKKDHMYKHTGIPAFKCKTCDARFPHSRDLSMHFYLHKLIDGKITSDIIRPIQDEKGNLSSECMVCELYLPKPIEADYHIKQHTEKMKKYKKRKKEPGNCQLCGKEVIDMQGHLETHGGKQYRCEICDKTFVRRDYLRRHLQTHGIRPPTCKHCGKRFSNIESMEQHENMHTNEMLFKCDICDAIFTKIDDLDEHVKQGNCLENEIENIIYSIETGEVSHANTEETDVENEENENESNYYFEEAEVDDPDSRIDFQYDYT